MPWIWKRRTAPRKSQEEKQKENTERTAYQVFQNRQLLGRSGDQQSDWQIAEKIVQNPVRRTLFASHRQLIKLEKGVWEPLLAWTNNQALLGLVGVLGNIGLITGVIVYVVSEKQRRDAEVLNAWQTITSAHGQSGSGGRIEALEFLNASPGANWRRKFPWLCPVSHPLCTWPPESLAGINLGVEAVDAPLSNQNSASKKDEQSDDRKPGVYLSQIQLPKADLRSANLTKAILSEANLEATDLQGANLEGANLFGASLQGVDLFEANLKGANLVGADLEEAELAGANLEGATLDFREGDFAWPANLQGVNLGVANLERAYLRGVSLREAFLWKANLAKANLKSASLIGANLREANLEGSVLKFANLDGVRLEGTDLTEVDLEDVNLAGAYYSNKQTSQQKCESLLLRHPCPTLFPEGFDPKAAGMELVE